MYIWLSGLEGFVHSLKAVIEKLRKWLKALYRYKLLSRHLLILLALVSSFSSSFSCSLNFWSFPVYRASFVCFVFLALTVVWGACSAVLFSPDFLGIVKASVRTAGVHFLIFHSPLFL